MEMAPGSQGPGRAPTLAGNIQETSTWFSVRFVLPERPLESSLSALCLATVSRTPWAPTLSPGLGAPTGIFHQGALTRDSPAAASKTSHDCLLPSVRASFAPCSFIGYT